jgi:hypothetical protein
MLTVVYNRFAAYQHQKADYSQWDEVGHALWKAAEHSNSEEEFVKKIVERLT